MLANVVAQTQLEESYLAASEPLVRFVLGPARGEEDRDDPRLRLDRFLKVIKADANLNRLRMVPRSMLTVASID